LAVPPLIDSGGLVEFDLADTNVDTIAIFFSEGASGLLTGTHTPVTGEPNNSAKQKPAMGWVISVAGGWSETAC
jgi:hypothetical protein